MSELRLGRTVFESELSRNSKALVIMSVSTQHKTSRVIYPMSGSMLGLGLGVGAWVRCLGLGVGVRVRLLSERILQCFTQYVVRIVKS